MQLDQSTTSAEAIQLRKKLTRIARGLRHTTLPEVLDYSLPQSVSSDTIRFKDTFISRKRIVLLTGSCSVASCTMCHLPNEALWKDRPQPTQKNLLDQFSAAFAEDKINNYDMITIYNNGNFFSDREVPPEVRLKIADQINTAGCKYLLVESLPQFITSTALQEMSTALGNTKLVLSIGLQSANDYVREVAVNSTCSKQQFERVVKEATELGHEIMTFLMLKPPFLTEQEGIDDMIQSLEYLTSLGLTETAICPTQVSDFTIADVLFTEKSFTPPWLWSAIEVLKIAQQKNLTLPRFATSVLSSSHLENLKLAYNCDQCSDRFIHLLEEYNNSRNIDALVNFSCSCKEEYDRQLAQAVTLESLESRITAFTQAHFV